MAWHEINKVITMDEKGFRQFLRLKGKKEHVVNGLVAQVQAFELYLACHCHATLEGTRPTDINSYADTLSESDTMKRMRALALYLKFAGTPALAQVAVEARENETAKHRSSFKLGEFRGVDMRDIRRLEACGIVTVAHMLAAGKTPGLRRRLAERTSISPPMILELVKLADLSRLGAVKSVRARLYYDAGLDTPDKFTQWEPENLRRMLTEFVEQTNFDGIPPLPKELANAIAKARELPKVVQY